MSIFKKTSAPILDAQKSFSNDSQGMYIVGPDGKSYAYANDHDPSDIKKTMDLGLQRYKASPPSQVSISAKEIETPYAISPAKTTSVVRVYSRIRPVPKGCSWLNNGPGRDFLWIYQDEVKKMLTAKPNGGTIKIPASLALRIARYHLMDNIRGTPDMWAASEVKNALFTARIVRDSANERSLAFSGSFKMAANSGKRGYEGTIDGEIAINTEKVEVARFRAYASGKAYGDGTYTPNAPKGAFNLVVAMIEARDAVARVVPPEAVSTENRDLAYHHPD
jgi:hypothetical protein